jgi:hypothetical protein
LSEFCDYTDKEKYDKETNTLRQQELSRREKALERVLEDHLKNSKITQSDIGQIIDPDVVF